MDASLLGDLANEASTPGFAPERSGGDLRYVGLVCPCEHDLFRVTGWPRVALGQGGFFWRSLTRVWREARLATQAGEPVESPFWLPLTVSCRRCERSRGLFDVEIVAGRLPPERQQEPQESLRCRVCRHGAFELVAGLAVDPAAGERIDVELVARCRACQRQTRVAWSRGRPDEQEIRLDLLYGRR